MIRTVRTQSSGGLIDRPSHDHESRRGRFGRSPLGRGGTGAGLLAVVLLSLGCRSLPRDPVDREYDDPPIVAAREEADARPGSEPRGTEIGGNGDRVDTGEGHDEGGDGSESGNGDEDSEPETWPNVQDPGPDMANFPNSAFTIPRGAAHVELAPVTLSGPTDDNGPNYSTQFLLRYGLTDRLELRIFGLGFVSVFNSPQNTTGFSPPAFDLKMNLWDESKNHLIPATGLEVYVQTEFGSPAFRSGVQPAASLLFDHTLPFEINFEWNVGFNGAQEPLIGADTPNGPINLVHVPESNVLEWNLQWALQRRFFETLDVFTHGYLNSSAIPGLGDGVVVGGGGVWTLNKQWSFFGSYNAGLNRDAPTTFFLLGFAWAL